MKQHMNHIVREDLGHIVAQDLPWNVLKDKTVLVTGASGFIATYIVEVLLYLNSELGMNITVIALVRNQKRAFERFIHHSQRADLRFVVQDVCDPIMVGWIERVDCIIHTASLASPKFYGPDPVGTILPNVFGTRNLLMFAQEKRTKDFIFLSSAEVYGETHDDQIPTREHDYGYMDPMNLRSCYGESKRMGENLCVSWRHQYGVPVKIVRPFHTYGPGMDLQDGRVFADFVSDIVHNRNIVMKSDGLSTRSFCYVADVALGIFTVLLCGKDGEAYNIGSRVETSILSLAEMLVTLFPEKKLAVVQDTTARTAGYVGTKIARTCAAIENAAAIGWEPTVDIRTGFTRTIRSYTE